MKYIYTKHKNRIMYEIMHKIYRQMVKNIMFCYESRKTEDSTHVFLSLAYDGEIIATVDITKKVLSFAKILNHAQ